MSEDPTIPQILERLTVVAPEFVRYNGVSRWYEVKIGPPQDSHWMPIYSLGEAHQQPESEYILFGAACEKIEAEGWLWEKYNKRFWIKDKETNGTIASYRIRKDTLLTVLSALLAALEGRVEAVKNFRNECSICDDNGQVTTIPGCDKGDFLKVKEDCPFCSGKKPKCNTCKGVGHVNYESCPDCSGKTKQ